MWCVAPRDEWRELTGGKGTISLQAAYTRPLKKSYYLIQLSGIIENLIVAQLVYKFLAFHESRSVCKSRTLGHVTSGLNHGCILILYLFIYFNIISANTPTPFPSGYQNKVTEAILWWLNDWTTVYYCMLCSVYVYVYTVIPRLTSDSANEFFG